MTTTTTTTIAPTTTTTTTQAPWPARDCDAVFCEYFRIGDQNDPQFNVDIVHWLPNPNIGVDGNSCGCECKSGVCNPYQACQALKALEVDPLIGPTTICVYDREADSICQELVAGSDPDVTTCGVGPGRGKLSLLVGCYYPVIQFLAENCNMFFNVDRSTSGGHSYCETNQDPAGVDTCNTWAKITRIS